MQNNIKAPKWNLVNKEGILTIILTIIVVSSYFIGFLSLNKAYRLIEASSGLLSEKMIIVLDAGHGGEDPGAIGNGGIYEKDLNLEICFFIGKMLEERGYTVVYTRTDDRLLYKPEENIKGIRKISDLKNRCEIANNYPNSIFVSIHMNTFGDSRYSGLQVYYGDRKEGSAILADTIQYKVKETLQKENNRKTKPGEKLYLLENIDCTAVLIECGFLSNKEECEKLSEKEYQKQLSFSIVCGIIEYIEQKS